MTPVWSTEQVVNNSWANSTWLSLQNMTEWHLSKVVISLTSDNFDLVWKCFPLLFDHSNGECFKNLWSGKLVLGAPAPHLCVFSPFLWYPSPSRTPNILSPKILLPGKTSHISDHKTFHSLRTLGPWLWSKGFPHHFRRYQKTGGGKPLKKKKNLAYAGTASIASHGRVPTWALDVPSPDGHV